MGTCQRLGKRAILESFQHRITTSIMPTLSAARRVLTDVLVECCRKELSLAETAEAEDMVDFGIVLPIVALSKRIGPFPVPRSQLDSWISFIAFFLCCCGTSGAGCYRSIKIDCLRCRKHVVKCEMDPQNK